MKKNSSNTRRLKNAEWVQEFFFIYNLGGVCGSCSWDIETRLRPPVFGSAREMFCLVERQACRKTPFVDGWADWVKPFLEQGLFVFRVLAIMKRPKNSIQSQSRATLKCDDLSHRHFGVTGGAALPKDGFLRPVPALGLP
jgi:hypothetical protein